MSKPLQKIWLLIVICGFSIYFGKVLSLDIPIFSEVTGEIFFDNIGKILFVLGIGGFGIAGFIYKQKNKL